MSPVGFMPSSGVLGLATLVAAALWVLMDTGDRLRPRVFLFVAAIPLYGVVCTRVLNAWNVFLPLKFDYLLFQIDKAMGVSAVDLGRELRIGPSLPVLCWVYRSVLIAMAIGYGLDLRSKGPSILRAYIAQLAVGPLLYALLPACGPIYAFPGFPWNEPSPGLSMLRLSADPNAVPSLHMSSALLLVIFARGRGWRLATCLYGAGIALSTLITGEHYVIDLVIGLPFACFAASMAWRRMRAAALYLAVVVVWMLAVRFSAAALVAHPALLKACALLTVAAALHAILLFWRTPVPTRNSDTAASAANSGESVAAVSFR